MGLVAPAPFAGDVHLPATLNSDIDLHGRQAQSETSYPLCYRQCPLPDTLPHSKKRGGSVSTTPSDIPSWA